MLEDKTVWITGGSAGIGLAAAKAFLGEGARVLITGRSAEKLARAQSALGCERLTALAWDVTDFSRMDARFDEALARAGVPDILVNNAGVALESDFRGDFFGTTEEMWDRVMDTNLKSMFFLCQKTIALWKGAGRGGRIVNVCSEQGFRPGAYTPYGLSKVAVNALTKGLARQFVKDGIIVNSVSPGATETDLQQGRTLIPAEKIADLIVFLAGEKAEIVAGETLFADRCEHLGVNWFE